MYKLATFCLLLSWNVSAWAQVPGDSTFYSLAKAMAKPEQVKHLILKNQNLDSLPPVLLSMKHLVELDLEGNRIQQFPGDLGQLPRLEVVRLSENTRLKLGTVLRQLEGAEHLKELDLSSCELEFVSYRIGRLTQLEELNLAHNQLKKLPSSLFYLSRLKVLDCTDNIIERIAP